LGNLGEDAGSSFAGAGTEGDDADDVIGATSVGADERTARVTHASGPVLAGLAESDDVLGKAAVFSQKLFGAPDSSGDLLKTVGESLWITPDQSPSGKDAVLGSTVVLARGRHASGSGVGAVEIDGLRELQKGDVVVELCADVVFLVNVDLGDSEVLLCAIEFQQLMLADANGVGPGVLAMSEAVSGAKNVLLSDQGSAADVTIHSEAKGDLPREFAVTSVFAVDDTASGAFLTALLEGRSGGNQHQEQANRLHRDFLSPSLPRK